MVGVGGRYWDDAELSQHCGFVAGEFMVGLLIRVTKEW